MARTTEEIFESIRLEAIELATDAGKADMVAMLSSTSRVAIWKILFFACAYGIRALEVLFDLFRIETDEKIAALKPHSARWFAELTKAFQYGFALPVDTDKYDNTGFTEDQIEDSKIVKHAAVVEQERGIRIKVAKEDGDDLGPLNADELSALNAYLSQTKPAGIKILLTSSAADDLTAKLRIFYNPLVLRADGGRADGTVQEPVQEAFKTFLKNLPFNGLFVTQMLVDAMQAVDGVVIAQVDELQTRYGALDFQNIDVEHIPDAGYLRLTVNGLVIQFIPHAGI